MIKLNISNVIKLFSADWLTSLVGKSSVNKERNITKPVVSLWIIHFSTIYIYCHPQTDCFVLSELFSVGRHSKPGTKPIQLYVRLSLRPLGQQEYHVG